MSTDHDVVIVGAGMVGALLGCLLVRDGLRVAVLDRAAPPRFRSDAEVGLRVSAISLGSRQLLDVAGAWHAIEASRASPYVQMRVWDVSGSVAGEISFDCAELGRPALGYIVENALMQSALLDALRQHANASVFVPASVEALRVQRDHAAVTLEDGRVLTARLVVGADGGGSATRSLAGIDVQGWDYEQRAVVAHVASARPHGGVARQRFMADGPLALLPLADGRCSIVWSTSPAHAAALTEMSPDEFGAAVSAASEQVLGTITLTSERASFPLRLQYAVDYTRPRIALVGDAAHSVHPLAGQGVNMGYLDAAALAEVVGDAARRGDDIGDAGALRRYERWRKSENLATMAMLDGLKRLFGSRDPVLGRVRDLGLNLVDQLAPVKHAFARRAMGLEGDLPRLLRRT